MCIFVPILPLIYCWTSETLLLTLDPSPWWDQPDRSNWTAWRLPVTISNFGRLILYKIPGHSHSRESHDWCIQSVIPQIAIFWSCRWKETRIEGHCLVESFDDLEPGNHIHAVATKHRPGDIVFAVFEKAVLLIYARVRYHAISTSLQDRLLNSSMRWTTLWELG